MKKKIYIIGKVTGLPEKDVVRKFNTASRIVRDIRFLPINPIEVVNNFEADWKTAMRKCIAALMTADGAYLLEDSKDSKGAQIEIELCQVLGIPTFSRYSLLQKHFGVFPDWDCDHPKDRQRMRTICVVANCETVQVFCQDCSTVLSGKVEC